MSKKKTKPRYTFIPTIRERIAAGVPEAFGTKEQALHAITRWEIGDDPRTPLEHGVFSMCETIRKQIEEQP